MIGEELTKNIDQTLDQLIQNAETISSVDLRDLSETELEAFQKTQESLLQRFLRMDEMIRSKPLLDQRSATVQIQRKLQCFQSLEMHYQRKVQKRVASRPIVCKRRCKKLLIHR